MTLFEKNRKLLEQYHPTVWALVCDVEPDTSCQVLHNQDGLAYLQVRTEEGATIDLYDFDGDETNVDWIPDDFAGLAYLLGFGMGYTALSLVEKRPAIRNLVIFDLSPSRFRKVMELVDLAPVISDPRVILSIDPNPDVPKVFQFCKNVLMTESIYGRQYLPAISIDPQAWKLVSIAIRDHINPLHIAGSTIKVRGELFWNNRLRNFASMNNDFFLEDLQGIFSGKPAILVGAGPSLNNNIHLLKGVEERAVIIAADSALPALIAQGVKPHFVTTLDAYDFTFEKIADQAPHIDQICMICAPIVTPKMPQIFPSSHVFWAFTNYAMESWFCRLVGGDTLIEGATTVAHLNFFSALVMGCSPMIFIGQDFAYSTSESHAAHTVLSCKNLLEKDFEEEGGVLWVKGTVEEKVPTNKSHYDMKLSMEHFIQSQADLICVNSTEGGAHIEGTEVMSLSESLSRYGGNVEVVSDVSHKISTLTRRSVEMKKGVDGMLNRVAMVERGIESLTKMCKKLRPRLQKYQVENKRYTSFSSFSSSFQEGVLEFFRKSEQLDTELDIWEFISDVTIDCLAESERLLHEISIYETQPEHYTTLMMKQLERIHYINSFRLGLLKRFGVHLVNIRKSYDLVDAYEKAQEKDDAEEESLKLVTYYLENRQYRAVLPYLEKLPEKFRDDPTLIFKRGCIAAYHSDYKTSEEYFDRALGMSIEIKGAIAQFQQDWGDEYLGHSLNDEIDSDAARRLLWKGLKYSPNHEGLCERLNEFIPEDILEMNGAVDGEISPAIESLIVMWVQLLSENKAVCRLLGKARQAQILSCYGKCLVGKGSLEKGLSFYRQSLELDQENPRCFLFAADVFFQKAEYGEGATYLTKAVALDSSLSHYWISLGDHLRDKGMFYDAALSYEFFLKISPGDADIIERMQECCIAIGQPEAASEASRKYGSISPKQ